MEWVPDKTGRFRERPKYTVDELEVICDREISTVQSQRHAGDSDRAVTDNDLTVLLENLGAEVELYADFSSEPGWVQGLTDFGREPAFVRIRRSLNEDDRYKNRLKSTLAHETRHFLTQKEAYRREGNVLQREFLCRRCHGPMSSDSTHDWSEYQADYCMGALLMRSRLVKAFVESIVGGKYERRFAIDSTEGKNLINQVAKVFEVSVDAARVRLSRLGYLGPSCQLRFRWPIKPIQIDGEMC